MKKIIRFSIFLAAFLSGFSCTNYHEEDAPDGISVNASELSFPSDASSRSLTVRSGSKWNVISIPEWISVKSINPSGNAFEWVVDFAATSNNEYNREGVIVLKARSESINIQAVQEGKKGKYFAVESVSLSEKELTLTVGDSFSLSCEIKPSNASIKDVTWESSVSSVATVSNTGQINAIAEGTTLITVTTNDGSKKATCTVTVKPVSVSSVSLDKESLTLTIGESSSLNASVLPENAANKNVSWSSSKTDVANVDSNGKVTALGVGKAMVTVTTEDGGKTATCIVTVNPISVTSVSLDQTSLTMTVGDSQSLTATVSPSNATDKSVSWSSNKTTVATVSSTGEVTAKAAGSAIITVTTTDGGKKATCSITVNEKTVSVTGVSLDKTSLSMIEGDSFALTATVLPSNATNKSVTWSSSNTSIATVSSSGLVTAKSVGTATITVKTVDGEKTATCSVTVKAKTISVTGVTLNKSTLTLTEGESQSLIATVTPSNASNKEVSWSTSNPFVATVSSSGMVTAKATGTTTITVKTSDGAKTATCKVTVTAATVAVTGVSLSVSSYTIKVNSSLQLHATITPSNATDQSVTWSSSNTSVATVSSDGLVSPKGVGTTTITVKTNDGGKTATCVITVEEVAIAVTGVSLNQNSISMLVGDTQMLTATVSPSNATNKNVTWSSSNTSVATVSSSGRVTAIAPGSATITVSTYNGFAELCWVTVSAGIINGYAFVEMGDGLKWATMNVGATKPEEDGDFFAWGETEPYYSTQNPLTWKSGKSQGYSWSSYKYTSDGGKTFTKYVTSSTYGTVDNKTILDIEDDAARRNMGGSWRLPTSDEWHILLDESKFSWVWTKVGVAYGYIVTSKVPGYEGNSIFIPRTTEFVDQSYVILASTDYWSSSSDGSWDNYVINDPGQKARVLNFLDSRQKGVSYSYRFKGLPIRPVSGTSQAVAVTGVSLNKSSLSMTVGDTQTLTATVSPSNATNKNVTWTSSNTSVATVSSSGLVTAKSAGTATITVKTDDGNMTATCLLKVQGTSNTENIFDIPQEHNWD